MSEIKVKDLLEKIISLLAEDFYGEIVKAEQELIKGVLKDLKIIDELLDKYNEDDLYDLEKYKLPEIIKKYEAMQNDR